jgi:hypothetical protein
MPTAKQTAANRMNSQNSTGPRTPQGQAASRYNAVKHGIFATTQIMFDEKAEDLAELAAEYHEHHSPADPNARFLVDTLVINEWRLRRLRRVEAELWQSASNAFLEKNAEVPACSSGDAFATAAPTFDRLQRIVNSCERAYHRALKELQRAKVGQALPPANPGPLPQKAEPAPADGPAAHTPQPEQSTPSCEKMASFGQNPPLRSPARPPLQTPWKLMQDHRTASRNRWEQRMLLTRRLSSHPQPIGNRRNLKTAANFPKMFGAGPASGRHPAADGGETGLSERRRACCDPASTRSLFGKLAGTELACFRGVMRAMAAMTMVGPCAMRA